MGLSFTNPWILLLWPLLIAYFVWLAGRSLADLSVWRRRLALGIRIVVATLLILALSGAQLVRYNRDLAVMFVLDYSDSIDAKSKSDAENYIRQAIKERGPNDQWGVVVFGREAYIDLAPGNSPSLGKISTVPPTEFTDIAAAIRLSMASLPDGMRKRLVILSDGNENLGNAIDEAQIAHNNDVAVDVAPLSAPQRREALLERLTLPSEAKVGEPVEIKTIARSTQDTPARIKLFRDGKFIGQKNVRLLKGKNVFVFPQSIEEAGAATFEAQLETPRNTDTQPENNRALGFVNVQGKPKILLVDNDGQQAQFLLKALQSEKLNVEVRGAGGLPTQLREMQAYDAIILGNVPAWDLTARQMLSLQSYVRDLGCGLVMVGGENSYGPGGYRSTPVEETLPVTMDIKNMQYLPGGAVAMIMHSCEFEGGNEWAKSVCSQVTRQLGDNDYAGLCIYGLDANWVYPMLKVGANRNRMLTLIRSINPGDMPDFDAALEVCYKGLINTKAYLKHCIILSDGDPSPPRPSLVKKFNDAKITVSTVVIQPHDNSGAQSMWAIARQHGGKFYQVKDPRQIPNIFLKEAATVSRSAIIEETFTPRLSAESSIMKGITRMPPLLGYVGTSAKPTAQTILESAQQDPILSTWQYGLGKSVAFTSDARQRWAAGWLGWSGFSKFWAQSVRWSMRQSTNSDLQTTVDIDKGVGKITIEAIDRQGNFLNFLNPKARLVDPNLKGRDLTLDQTGPGRYEATFDARQLGTYLVNIRTTRNGKTVSQITGGVLPYSPEYNAVGTDEYLLRRVAEAGGGEGGDQRLKPEQIFTRPRTVAPSPRDIWLSLLMIAACLFPLDVAIRRLMWGETEIANLRKRLRRSGSSASAPSPKPREHDATMDRLLRSRRRPEAIENTESTTQPAPTPPATPTRPVPPTSGATPSPVAPPTPPPTTTPPSSTQAPQTPPAPEPEEELDPMERLRRAKRRARGEE